MIRRALVAKLRVEILGNTLAQHVGYSALADPGLTGEQHNLPFTVPGLLPAITQQCQFRLAADERREISTARGLEAPFGCRDADDLPRADRRGESLDRVLAQIGQVECCANQAPRRGGDHNFVSIRQPLHASREVRRFTDCELGYRGIPCSCLADNDRTGGDADAYSQWRRHR